MIRRFEVLLHGIVADPERPISMLPLLMETEKHQLLVEWNETHKDYPKDKCLHQLFEEQVERLPEAVSVICGDQRLSYRELNEQANRLAHHLRKIGVRSEMLVGIYLERSLEMVVALLGILKAGAAYVPLDPQYPKQRLAFMLEDTQVSVVLTQQRLVTDFPEHPTRVVCLDVEDEAIRTESAENPVSEAMVDSLAYVIYTSGSTGNPKGVMISHSGICNRLLWGQEAYHLSDRDRVLHAFSLSFDFATWEIFTSLVAGAQLIIAEPLGSQDSSYLARLIDTSKVTLAGFVPSMLNAILDEPKFKLCSSLKRVVSGGETLSVELQERFLAARPDVELQNTYGPTEASIDVTFWVCNRANDSGRKRQEVPIGRPIANTELYILDSHLQPVPIGVAGELHVDGAGLARGYLNRPDLTAERFIPSPFSDEPGARLYKTGDLARYLPDGTIEFIGRRDNQVKIRGFRIELGEIEAALTQHSKVQAVVACAHEYAPADKRLVAYVVPHSGQDVSTADLRNFLAHKLPSYMVPSNFVMLEALPLAHNGKVDRKAVPALDLSRLNPQASYVAPRSAIEEMLVEIWAEVLKRERVSVYDNFFDLGGHSLLATQVMSRTCQAFQVDLPLRTLFEDPSVAELGNRIEEAYREDQRPSTRPIVPVSRDRDLPLSFSQERLWFVDQYEPNSSVYNIRSALRLRGSLDAVALEQSLNEIVRRHESLRTTFLTVDGEPVQVIAPWAEVSFPLVDLTGYPEGEREEEAQRLVSEEAGRPFDLANGPLFRPNLLRVAEDDHVLLLTIHHIVSDGWSMGVLRRELSVLYQAFAKGEPSPLPELPVQYADFAVWQREWLQGEVLNSQLSYWKKQLERLPEVVNLPTDRPGLAVQSHRGARQSFVLSKDLTEKLKALSRKQGVTLYMTLLASFKVLIYRYSGQEDLVIGSPIAGRNRPELDGLIGFFVNTLVLRSDLSGNPVFCELLKRIREVCLRAYAHQELPFQKLVEALRPKGNTGRRSLARILFVFQNVPRQRVEIPGITVTPIRTDVGIAKSSLTLFMWESQESLAGSVNYSTDLFNAATIGRMIEHLQTLLTAVVADPKRRLLDMPPFLEESRSELLEAIHWATELPSHFEIDESVGCEQGEL
jgi:amino acid adenylation domain-containing protein